MKPFLIYFWHGKADGIANKLRKFCRVVWGLGGEEFFFDGTIAEWHEKWGDKYMFLKPRPKDGKEIAGLLCVTQFNTFGQR